MPLTRARVKPMDSIHYPNLSINNWYPVSPLWPGVTQRMVNLLGERLLNGAEKKLKLPTPRDVLMHEYFADYRRPLSLRSCKNVSAVYKYTMDTV